MLLARIILKKWLVFLFHNNIIMHIIIAISLNDDRLHELALRGCITGFSNGLLKQLILCPSFTRMDYSRTSVIRTLRFHNKCSDYRGFHFREVCEYILVMKSTSTNYILSI